MGDLCKLRVELDEKHEDKCVAFKKEYDACGARLEERGWPEGETCAGWYADYIQCLDRNVSLPQLFFIFFTFLSKHWM